LTIPGQSVHAVLRVDGQVIGEEDVVVAAAESNAVSVTLPTSSVSPGATFEAEFLQGSTSLLSGQLTLN
jgi:hypothetical protein